MIPVMPRRVLRLGQSPRPEQAHSELADWQVAGCHGSATPAKGGGVPGQGKSLAAAKQRGRGGGEVKGMVGSSVPNELQVFERLPALFFFLKKEEFIK